MTTKFAKTACAALVLSLSVLGAAEARTGANGGGGSQGHDSESAAELAAAGQQQTHAWPFPIPWMSDDMYFKACKKAGGGASLDDDGDRHCSDSDGHPVLVPFPIPIP